MAAAYVIVAMNITDPARYREYMAAAQEVVKAAGGEYLVRGGRHETLEGNWQPHRVGVLRFPSYAAAKAFYDGAQYTAARAKRKGTTEYFDAVLVEGVETPVF
ncbi:MAG: DUF1330 domain-containing protein [Ideonella sp.]|nr:DUF1330 domain-containing protein [Ideonella sp.]MCC7457457.1 DUF1330 domain-containing protein [Nitrospira sp.]